MTESPPRPQPSSASFRVTSTSRDSAVVTPIPLRETPGVRLVFRPELVNNPSDPSAAIRGAFCYQKKRRCDEWVDAQAIPLSSLKTGEGVRVELHAAELLKLFRGLSALYEAYARDGISTGSHAYVKADPGSVLGDVATLLQQGGAEQVQRTFLAWARESGGSLADHLAGVDSESLINFDAAIGVARLRRFLTEARGNLSNDDEDYWQGLLRREPWVISQIYASPMIIVREQAYVGGKSIDNRGGSIVDYMFANALTENSLIVEIKTPPTPLLRERVYRNGIYAPSTELAGATQQVLHARQTLQEQYLSLASGQSVGFNIFGTRALLIIGTVPAGEPDGVRSFEIYRNAQRGIEIVTFDELITKGQHLLETLSR
jgi:hypothetical protein